VDNSENINLVCVDGSEDTAIKKSSNRASAARPKTNGQLAAVKIFLRLSGKNKMKIIRARFGSDFNNPFQIPLQQKNFF
jgi:hypothetical protein